MYDITAIWGDWGAWQDCSTTCGSGRMVRVKECVNPGFKGISCEGEQPSESKHYSDGQCRI